MSLVTTATLGHFARGQFSHASAVERARLGRLDGFRGRSRRCNWRGSCSWCARGFARRVVVAAAATTTAATATAATASTATTTSTTTSTIASTARVVATIAALGAGRFAAIVLARASLVANASAIFTIATAAIAATLVVAAAVVATAIAATLAVATAIVSTAIVSTTIVTTAIAAAVVPTVSAVLLRTILLRDIAAVAVAYLRRGGVGSSGLATARTSAATASTATSSTTRSTRFAAVCVAVLIASAVTHGRILVACIGFMRLLVTRRGCAVRCRTRGFVARLAITRVALRAAAVTIAISTTATAATTTTTSTLASALASFAAFRVERVRVTVRAVFVRGHEFFDPHFVGDIKRRLAVRLAHRVTLLAREQRLVTLHFDLKFGALRKDVLARQFDFFGDGVHANRFARLPRRCLDESSARDHARLALALLSTLLSTLIRARTIIVRRRCITRALTRAFTHSAFDLRTIASTATATTTTTAATTATAAFALRLILRSVIA